jgi:hypothetical protein
MPVELFKGTFLGGDICNHKMYKCENLNCTLGLGREMTQPQLGGTLVADELDLRHCR